MVGPFSKRARGYLGAHIGGWKKMARTFSAPVSRHGHGAVFWAVFGRAAGRYVGRFDEVCETAAKTACCPYPGL
jgi:hypothetical protein